MDWTWQWIWKWKVKWKMSNAMKMKNVNGMKIESLLCWGLFSSVLGSYVFSSFINFSIYFIWLSLFLLSSFSFLLLFLFVIFFISFLLAFTFSQFTSQLSFTFVPFAFTLFAFIFNSVISAFTFTPSFWKMVPPMMKSPPSPGCCFVFAHCCV